MWRASGLELRFARIGKRHASHAVNDQQNDLRVGVPLDVSLSISELTMVLVLLRKRFRWVCEGLLAGPLMIEHPRVLVKRILGALHQNLSSRKGPKGAKNGQGPAEPIARSLADDWGLRAGRWLSGQENAPEPKFWCIRAAKR